MKSPKHLRNDNEAIIRTVIVVGLVIGTIVLTVLAGVIGYVLALIALGFLIRSKIKSLRLPYSLNHDIAIELLLSGLMISLAIDYFSILPNNEQVQQAMRPIAMTAPKESESSKATSRDDNTSVRESKTDTNSDLKITTTTLKRIIKANVANAVRPARPSTRNSVTTGIKRARPDKHKAVIQRIQTTTTIALVKERSRILEQPNRDENSLITKPKLAPTTTIMPHVDTHRTLIQAPIPDMESDTSKESNRKDKPKKKLIIRDFDRHDESDDDGND